MTKVFTVVATVVIIATSCDRRPDPATKRDVPVPTTATVVARSYNPQLDETTLSSPSVYRDLDGRRVGLSARYTFRGRVPSAAAKTVTLWITSKPEGRPLSSESIPLTLSLDGRSLKPANGSQMVAETGVLKGIRYYAPELELPDFTTLVTAPSTARIIVNDVTIDLSPAERAELARLLPELPK